MLGDANGNRTATFTSDLQINQKISKTTHLKEMNVEIEKLKAQLIATREKNGERQAPTSR